MVGDKSSLFIAKTNWKMKINTLFLKFKVYLT